MNSAHIHIVNSSFVFKGAGAYLTVAPAKNLPARRQPGPGETAMYVRELDYGTPVARKTASILVAAVLISFIVLPILAVGARIVA